MPSAPRHGKHASQRPLLPSILPVEPDQPLRWLVLGFRDLTRNPWLSLLHGLVTALAGWLITWLAFDQFWLLVSLILAFMVGAPVLATSLYALSRAIEHGQTVNLALLINTWESKAGKFGTFVIFLGLAFGMVGFIAKGMIQWLIDGR